MEIVIDEKVILGLSLVFWIGYSFSSNKYLFASLFFSAILVFVILCNLGVIAALVSIVALGVFYLNQPRKSPAVNKPQEFFPPPIGSLWKHENGVIYVVVMIANGETQRPEEYPVTVVYKSIADSKIWCKDLEGFYAKRTRHIERNVV